MKHGEMYFLFGFLGTFAFSVLSVLALLYVIDWLIQ